MDDRGVSNIGAKSHSGGRHESERVPLSEPRQESGGSAAAPEGVGRCRYGYPRLTDHLACGGGLLRECFSELSLAMPELSDASSFERSKTYGLPGARSSTTGNSSEKSMRLASFNSDKLADGSNFRILTVVDQFTRECVWLQADRTMTGAKVAIALTQATIERRAMPVSMELCNGTEFASRALESWASVYHELRLCFIRPRRSVENGLLEASLPGSRDECFKVSGISCNERCEPKTHHPAFPVC